MELTSAGVTRYVGGQIEAQSKREGYLYRGEIATIAVEGAGDRATLKVTLNWKAKLEGWPSNPTRWVNEEELTYDASLLLYAVSDIGDGRISLYSPYVFETTVLFPPDSDNVLDPARVEGLDFTT